MKNYMYSMLLGLFLMTAFWGCKSDKCGTDPEKPPVDTTTVPKDSLNPKPVVRDTTFMRLVGKWYFADGGFSGGEEMTLNADGTGLLTTYGSTGDGGFTHVLTWDAAKDKLDLTYDDVTYHRTILRWRNNDWYNIKPRGGNIPYEYIRFTNRDDIPQAYWDVVSGKES